MLMFVLSFNIGKLLDNIEMAKKLILARLSTAFGEGATMNLGRDVPPIDGPISPKLEAYCDSVMSKRTLCSWDSFPVIERSRCLRFPCVISLMFTR